MSSLNASEHLHLNHFEFLNKSCRASYRSSDLVVVEVDLRVDVGILFFRVQKFPRVLHAVLEIVGAAAPFPFLRCSSCSFRFETLRIAAAVEKAPLAARFRHRHRDTCRRNRIGERCFFVTYRKETKHKRVNLTKKKKRNETNKKIIFLFRFNSYKFS